MNQKLKNTFTFLCKIKRVERETERETEREKELYLLFTANNYQCVNAG